MSKIILEKKNPCWKGYKQLGMKRKKNREVPNCVPEERVDEFFNVIGVIKKSKKSSPEKHNSSKEAESTANELIDKEIARRDKEREKLRQKERAKLRQEEYRNIARKSEIMTKQATKAGITAGGAQVGARALRTGGVRNAIRNKLGLPSRERKHPGADNLDKKAAKTKARAAKIIAVQGSHKPGLVQDISSTNKQIGVEKNREKIKKMYAAEERDPKGPTKSYKSINELAKKHDVSVDFIETQLKSGIKVEKEHTSSDSQAKVIASQHLDEDPNYYIKLKKIEAKKTNESISFEIGSGHNSARKQARIRKLAKDNPNPHEATVAKRKLKGPNLPLKEDQIDETMRIQTKSGNLMSVMLSWRGRYYQLQMFFPTLKFPSRKEVTFEIQKIYPDSKLLHYRLTSINPNQPIVHANIKESLDKSKMKCNSPKAQAVGDSKTGKSHVVKACSGGKEKILRFGQKGVKGSPKKEGESEAYANRRKRFQARHAENISKGKMSAAYWANKVKW